MPRSALDQALGHAESRVGETTSRLADLVRLRLAMKKIMPFIITADHTPVLLDLDGDSLRQRFLPPAQQLELDFDNPVPTKADAASVISGEM